MFSNKLINSINNNEFFKGFIVGSSQTFSGHPLDTIKTNMQLKKKIDIKYLYKGFSFPFLSNSVINSIMFGTYSYTYKKTNEHFISGFLSGSCPVRGSRT